MNEKPEQQILLAPDDVATQLQVTAEQVRCLIRKGQLSALHFPISKQLYHHPT
jgi:hypothetical protein